MNQQDSMVAFSYKIIKAEQNESPKPLFRDEKFTKMPFSGYNEAE